MEGTSAMISPLAVLNQVESVHLATESNIRTVENWVLFLQKYCSNAFKTLDANLKKTLSHLPLAESFSCHVVLQHVAGRFFHDPHTLSQRDTLPLHRHTRTETHRHTHTKNNRRKDGRTDIRKRETRRGQQMRKKDRRRYEDNTRHRQRQQEETNKPTRNPRSTPHHSPAPPRPPTASLPPSHTNSTTTLGTLHKSFKPIFTKILKNNSNTSNGTEIITVSILFRRLKNTVFLPSRDWQHSNSHKLEARTQNRNTPFTTEASVVRQTSSFFLVGHVPLSSCAVKVVLRDSCPFTRSPSCDLLHGQNVAATHLCRVLLHISVWLDGTSTTKMWSQQGPTK